MTKEEINALRFNVQNGKKVIQDAFITGMMELFFVRSQMGIFTGRGRTEKLLRPAEELLKLGLASQDDETRALFVEAYKDAGLTFIKISREDRSYSTGLLNIGRISDEQFKAKVRDDFRLLGTELPQKGGREKTFAPFTEGLQLAYDAYFSKKESED